MNIESKNTPVYDYRLYDFARPQGKEIVGGIAKLTAYEARTMNRAFALNHTQKKYIREHKQ